MFGVFSNNFELLVLGFEVDQVLAHLMRFFLFIAAVALEPLIALRVRLGLLHSPFHVLDELCQLPIFIVFLLEGDRNVTVLLLHLGDHGVPLLELLLNYFEFLWVRERVLRSDHLFKLKSQAGALLHVKFHLNFHFLLASAPDVSLEGFNLVTAPLVLIL